MALIVRFSRTERAAHWLVAAAFAAMLLIGTQVPHHWTFATLWFDVHVGAAVVLIAGLAALLLGRGGRRLWASIQELRRFDGDDRAWLSPTRIIARRPPPPVGRFNGGQKVNARLALAGLVGLYATGPLADRRRRRTVRWTACAVRRPHLHADRRPHLHGRAQPGDPARAQRHDAGHR
jgi:cytochrome b subunit of formate dehydrogenase